MKYFFFFFFTRLLIQMRLKFWHRLGVTSLKVCHVLTRVTQSSSVYQRMERIVFPVLLHLVTKQRRLEKN